jgi:hypothetical protein
MVKAGGRSILRADRVDLSKSCSISFESSAQGSWLRLWDKHCERVQNPSHPDNRPKPVRKLKLAALLAETIETDNQTGPSGDDAMA